jgi:hypothetical protein
MVGSIYLAPNLNGHPDWAKPFARLLFSCHLKKFE